MNFDGYCNASLADDGPVSDPNGILIKLSKKTKYMSIEGKIGESIVERIIMIDTGASISLVDENIPFIKEIDTNTSIRFGNGTTAIAKSKRLICIYVNNRSIRAWAYVTKGLPTLLFSGWIIYVIGRLLIWLRIIFVYFLID